MKHIYTFIWFLFAFVPAISQSIQPIESSEYCPNVEYTFTASLIKPFSTIVCEGGCVITQTPSGLGSNSITFKAKFGDFNQRQIFRILHTDGTTQLFQYIKIKSLFYSTSCAQIPNQTAVTFPRCQVATASIILPAVKWGANFESPTLCFGSITDYEYQLPITVCTVFIEDRHYV